MSNKEVTIIEQRRVINSLQAQVMDLDGRFRGLRVSYDGLQRNFAFLVASQDREVEKIQIEKDNIFSQLLAIQSSVEEDDDMGENISKRVADVTALADRNNDLTAANAALKYKFSLFQKHIEDWKRTYAELDIYSRGLESLLQVRGFTRIDMSKRPSPRFDVIVKQELGAAI